MFCWMCGDRPVNGITIMLSTNHGKCGGFLFSFGKIFTRLLAGAESAKEIGNVDNALGSIRLRNRQVLM